MDEFCTHWLDHLINAECKWIRFEWQAHGSIHPHGCAKLSNNPGFCSLVKTAAQGWKLEQILRLHKHPSYHQMANKVQPYILVAHQARATVIAYADWLLTTMNDALPQENWAVPSPYRSAISL